jgi:hypothetical protein
MEFQQGGGQVLVEDVTVGAGRDEDPAIPLVTEELRNTLGIQYPTALK